MKCPFARERGAHPRAIDFITDLITWRKEQGAGLDSIHIPQWVDTMIKHEMGESILAIDGTKLLVVPNTENLAIVMGLIVETSDKQ